MHKCKAVTGAERMKKKRTETDMYETWRKNEDVKWSRVEEEK